MRIWDFQTFNEPELIGMLDAATSFAVDMEYALKPYWMVLLGPSGVGKTMLAERIWKYFKDAAQWYVEPKTGANLVHNGRYVKWPAAVKAMKGGDYGRIEDLESEWFAIIDDIGADHDPSKNAASNLCRVLDRRLNMWTVVTSNLSLQEIAEQIDGRIASRLNRNSVLLQITALDFSCR